MFEGSGEVWGTCLGRFGGACWAGVWGHVWKISGILFRNSCSMFLQQFSYKLYTHEYATREVV